MHYNFYFDEIYHDRKITIKSSGTLNALMEDKNDSYVGVFWGVEGSQQASTTRKLHVLEEKYVKRYGLPGEFKSTTITKKHFRFGIRSFNNYTLDFYEDFFDLLKEVKPIIHVNVLSKVELLVRQLIDYNTLNQLQYVIPNAFYYSLTKFLFNYHSPQLIKALYTSSEQDDCTLFKHELLSHIEKVLSALEGIPRKKKEIPTLKQLHLILSCYDFAGQSVDKKYDFVYFQVFEGLMKLLKELKISPNNVNITIDKENQTYQTALEYKFGKIKQSDSTNCIQIRCADHLCGFIGRLMFALVNDEQLKEAPVTDINCLEKNDLVRKHLLRPEWFDLQLRHFQLYCQAYNVLVSQQNAYWSSMSWSYADQVIIFYVLLNYIANYNSFESYKIVTPERHAELFNNACCMQLEKYYTKL